MAFIRSLIPWVKIPPLPQRLTGKLEALANETSAAVNGMNAFRLRHEVGRGQRAFQCGLEIVVEYGQFFGSSWFFVVHGECGFN